MAAIFSAESTGSGVHGQWFPVNRPGTHAGKRTGQYRITHCAHQYAGRGNSHQCGGFVDALAKGNEEVQSVNAVVGETNDGYLNDIRGRYVTEADVLQAINTAGAGAVTEGNVGAGTGTVCFGLGRYRHRLPCFPKPGWLYCRRARADNFGVYLRLTASPWEKN